MNCKIHYSDSIELYCEEYGSGYPLIFLHGNGESLNYFSRQIEFFKDYFRVIAVDTRGHGNTPRGTAPFTISQFADDLNRFMILRGIHRAHIAGFSDGGNTAMVFAMRYPNKVAKLILNGANLNGRGVKARYQIFIILGCKIAELFAGKSIKSKSAAEMFGLMVYDPDIHPEDLANIKAETLVLVGARDMIKPKHSKLIASKIPLSQSVTIEGDHFIAAKKPLEYNRVVLDFLQNN